MWLKDIEGWRALVNTMKNLRALRRAGNFTTRAYYWLLKKDFTELVIISHTKKNQLRFILVPHNERAN
jgi:hypothetical protein